MAMSLRLATQKDLATVVQFVKAYHEFDQTPPYETDAIEQAVEPLLQSEELGQIWLILWEDYPIGYIALCFGYSIEFSGRDAFIDEFFIVSDYRGKGLGRAVLAQIQAQTKTYGIQALHLEVGRSNARAQRLYKALDFEERERFMLMSYRVNPEH